MSQSTPMGESLPQELPPFEIDTSLDEWNIPAAEWLSKNAENLEQRGVKLDGLASGAVVFNHGGDRVLIIQRASTDSMPNRWEIPGGAVDDEDRSIVHGATRELWEEAGLVARRVTRLVAEGPGGRDLQVFPNRHGTRWFCRFPFEVEVEDCDSVKLDPAEHQAHLWATEQEVRLQSVADRQVPFINSSMQALILNAFRLRKQVCNTVTKGTLDE